MQYKLLFSPPVHVSVLLHTLATHDGHLNKWPTIKTKIKGLDLLKQDCCDNDLHSESLGYDCTGSQSIHYESDTESRFLQTIPFSFGKKPVSNKNWREFTSSQSPTDSEHKNM